MIYLLINLNFLETLFSLLSQYIGSILIVCGTIAGIFIGYSLTILKEKKAEKRQIKSIHDLISLEIDQNIVSLQNFWDKLNKEAINYEKGEEKVMKRQLAKKLANWPLNKWIDTTWKNQNILMPIAFDSDEIREIGDFYNQLEMLNSIRLSLSYLKAETNEFWIKTYNDSYQRHNSDYSDDARGHWEEFEKITIKTLGKGNPMDKK